MTYKKLTSVILAAFLALGATACSGGSSSSSSASASSSSTSASADASSNGDVKKLTNFFRNMNLNMKPFHRRHFLQALTQENIKLPLQAFIQMTTEEQNIFSLKSASAETL